MIIVDTSVLIDYFRAKKNQKVAKFEYVVNNNIPFGINSVIYQEILQGASSNKEFELLKEYLSSQIFYELKDKKTSYEGAAKIFFKCREKGITVRSTIDLVIAQTALEGNLFLLHNDSDFDNIAKVIKELKIY